MPPASSPLPPRRAVLPLAVRPYAAASWRELAAAVVATSVAASPRAAAAVAAITTATATAAAAFPAAAPALAAAVHAGGASHYVGGGSLPAAAAAAERLAAAGVGTYFDYAVEGIGGGGTPVTTTTTTTTVAAPAPTADADPVMDAAAANETATADRAEAAAAASIAAAAALRAAAGVPVGVVVKPTSFASAALLCHVSGAAVAAGADDFFGMTSSLAGRSDGHINGGGGCGRQRRLPSGAAAAPTVEDLSSLLSPRDAAAYGHAAARLRRLATAAASARVTLLLDAEAAATRPAVDALGLSTVLAVNTPTVATVHTTAQMYLNGGRERLVAGLAAARDAGVVAGVKLVRGAYVRAEVAGAAAGGRRSPLLPGGKRAVDAVYDSTAVGLLPAVRAGHVALVVATHNASSVGAVVDAAAVGSGAVGGAGAPPPPHRGGSPGLSFAQLAGMSDGLTAALAAGGWATAKYLPYGPPLECLPYLLRRAEENADAMGGARADARAAWREVAARLWLTGGKTA
ncbi:hypothetical protein MMPV_007044 [Pyropia vietnamensis]